MFTVLKRALTCGGTEWEGWLVESDERLTQDQVKQHFAEQGIDALVYGFLCRSVEGKYRSSWTEHAGSDLIERRKNHEHSYHSKTVGRCLTRYTCEICGDYYEIDSSD